MKSVWVVYSDLVKVLVEAWALWRGRHDDYFKAKEAEKEAKKEEKRVRKTIENGEVIHEVKHEVVT